MQQAASRPASIVRPRLLSHGTIACRDLVKSRAFYEEFLGLDVVRHGPRAMLVRLNCNLYVVCVRLGEKVPESHFMFHWGLDVATREEVDEAHEHALRLREKYELRAVKGARDFHGAYGFMIQDRDSTWWEIQHEPRGIDAFYGAGDAYDMLTDEPIVRPD